MKSTMDNPYIDDQGRALAIGVFVEVDTNDPDGHQDFGQLIDGPDKDGIWTYRNLYYGEERVSYAANTEIARYHPEPKQTEAARATRRKLRTMGFRINHYWGDGLVQMSRSDGIIVTTRLDGSVRVSHKDVLNAVVDVMNEGISIANAKGIKL